MEAQSWVEVRPLLTGRFEPGNLAGILDILYNSGKPFRFIAVSGPSARIAGARSVRLFFQLWDADSAKRMVDVLRAGLDVEVVEGAVPPLATYERCVEFALKNRYALPVCALGEKPQSNPVDGVIAALSDAVFEVVAVGDASLRRGILQYIYEKTKKGASFTSALADAAAGVIDGFFGGPPPKEKGKKEPSPLVKERVEAAMKKANQNLFLCEVRAYGDERTVTAIQEVLPSTPMNCFIAARVLKGTEEEERVNPPMQLSKPRSFRLNNALLSKLWAVPILLLLFPLWIPLGFFDPLRLSNLDLTLTVLAVVPAALLGIKFRRREPVGLCRDELSLIVAMPTAIGKLPVETGTARITRERLVFAERLQPRAPALPEGRIIEKTPEPSGGGGREA